MGVSCLVLVLFTLLCVFSSISPRKLGLVALLSSIFYIYFDRTFCKQTVENLIRRQVVFGVLCLFLTVSQVSLQFVNVAFPGHTHLLVEFVLLQKSF